MGQVHRNVGMPLVSELDDEFKSYLTPEKLRTFNNQWRANGTGYPDDAIENLVKLLEHGDMHYEDVLGNLEVNFHRRTTGQAYHGLYGIVAEIIYGLLLEKHTHNIHFIERNIGFLGGINVLAQKNEPLWIFSLNHDLMIECLSAHFGIPMSCGFSEEVIQLPRRDTSGEIIGELRAHVLPGELVEGEVLPFFGPSQSGINLFKLHGSLDVFAFRDGKDLLKFTPSNDSVAGVIEALLGANKELLYIDPRFAGGRIWTINEINYADYAGVMQFLRKTLLAGAFKFDNRFSQVLPQRLLAHFASNLNRLTKLICIGYGFGDHHINQVMREWLEFNRTRQLMIVDPNFQKIPDSLRHLAPQIESSRLDCTDFLDQEAGITRTRLDDVSRKFGGWKRRNRPEAESKLDEFRRREMRRSVGKIMDVIKTLPIKDGDVDFETLGLTREECLELFRSRVPIASPEDMLERFITEQEPTS